MTTEHGNKDRAASWMTPAFAKESPGEVAAREGGETVTLSIDEQSIEVPTGTNVLEAARRLDIEISAFCYHPGLSVAAVCRQCLIRVKGTPKPMPACQAICSEGMEVSTGDPDVVDRRRAMLEFTLLNHPIDCPICDKSGECILQKLYFDHNAERSRTDVPKVHKRKVVDVGRHIILDEERCILCTRCIRVCDEVAAAHELDMARRGDRQVLTTAPGAHLDNPYSINTVDVCPVGALTSKDYRFTMRAWELLTTPSICTGCATGCNIEVHHREGHVYRLQPRYNRHVNKHWMCDEGRETYKPLSQDRVSGPSVEGLPASWPRALEVAARMLRAALESHRGRVGVVLSAQHTNEDNFVLAELARHHWHAGHLYLTGKPRVPERADRILRDADVNPNARGARVVVGADAPAPGDVSRIAEDLQGERLAALVVLGADVALPPAIADKAAKLAPLIVLAHRDHQLAPLAHVLLPVAAWAEVEGTLINRQGLVQQLHAAIEPPGLAKPAWKAIAALGRATGAGLEFSNARSIFDAMTEKLPDFCGAQWERSLPPVQLRFAHSRG